VAVQAFLQGALGGCLSVLAYGMVGRRARGPLPGLCAGAGDPACRAGPGAGARDGLQAAGIVLCTLGLVTGLGILRGRRLAAVTPAACPSRP
jgi:hypothetical protein